MADRLTSIHGCALVLGTTGLIIRGPSGSGKSALANALIERWHGANRHACWVADDRVSLRIAGSTLLAGPVAPIAGRAELRFLGIREVAFMQSTAVDYLIDLVPQNMLQRMPKKELVQLVDQGPETVLFHAPAHNTELACSLVAVLLQADCIGGC